MTEESHTSEAVPLPAPTPEPLGVREVLSIPVMRRLWYAQIVSVFGDFLALFAVITIMTFRLHATPQQITGIQIAYLAPIAILGVLSGVFVDRWPVKLTLVSSDYIRALLCLGLLFVHNVTGFYIVLAAISIVSSFFSPAQGVALRSAVPVHGFGSAQTLMQQVMFIMRIIGGPIAATLVASFGAKPCYWVDAASFIASGSLIASLTIIVPKPEPELPASAVVMSEPTGLARIWRDMKQGTNFILHHSAVLFVIVALAAAMFTLGCFGPLIAVYVRDTLHGTISTFRITLPMIGVGMMLGVNLLNAKAKNVKATTLVYFGLGGIAVGTLLLAVFPVIYVAVAGLLLIGFAAAGIIVPSQTLIAQETPAPMMGRVGSTVMSAIFTAQIAGLILSGILAEHTSVRRVFALCTAMLAVLTVAGKLWMEPKHDAPPSTLGAS